MDALLTNTQTPQNVYPFWGFQVVNNVVPIISGVEELSQQAAVIAYTQLGLWPQLPSKGVNLVGLLMNTDSLANIDTQIVQGISQARLPYKPKYSQNGNKLNINIIPLV